MNKEWFGNHKEQLIGILGLLVIVLGVGYLYQQQQYAKYNRPVPSMFANPFERNLSAGERTIVTDMVKAFPADLILDKTAKEYDATAIKEGKGWKIMKAFDSQLSVSALSKLYQDGLKKNGWELKSQLPMTDGIALFFSNTSNKLNVTIAKKGSASVFTLSFYLGTNNLASPSPTASPK